MNSRTMTQMYALCLLSCFFLQKGLPISVYSMDPSLTEKLKGALKDSLEKIGQKYLLELNTLVEKKGEHAKGTRHWQDRANKPKKNRKQQGMGKYRKDTNGDVLQRKPNCQQDGAKIGGNKKSQTKKTKTKRNSVVHCHTENHHAMAGTEPPQSRTQHKPKRGKNKTPQSRPIDHHTMSGGCISRTQPSQRFDILDSKPGQSQPHHSQNCPKVLV